MSVVILMILLVVALICVVLSFVPRFELMHRAATILVVITLMLYLIPKGD